MTVLRCVWWATLLGGVVPAAVLGVVASPTIFVVVTTAGLGAVGAAYLSGARYPWDKWGENAVAGTLVAVASPVLAWRTFPVGLLLIATSTTFARSIRARAGARPALGKLDRPASTRSTYVGVCLRSMSGRELCQAWLASFARVKSADLRDRRLGAGVRRSLLDELERRDATRFRAWLARSPSPASEPLWVLSLPSAVRRPRRRAPEDEPFG